ncbi:recombinase family protein [Streptomyces sp. NPDC001339]|uniref:recombinase family protein n=1 Tax=Streptomyces sp. NPDC001339 TaxID=3364563 RepID=UPI003687BE7B
MTATTLPRPSVTTLRALGAVRLSVGSGGQTGDDTQRRRIQKRVDADELTFVDFAEDIDVSASLSPWLRPSLGDWLNNRRDEFDVIYVFKIDRIARSVKDLCALLDWCDEHGKSLVSIEEGFDLSTPWGRTIAKILAVLAEAELEAIKARIRASREAMREAGRWPGGLVPFGRVAVKDGDGFTLALCPEYGPVLLEMIRLFISAKSFAVVADWLNVAVIHAGDCSRNMTDCECPRGVPTSQDIARMRAAAGTSTTRLDQEKAKPRGARWSPTAVQAVLTSRSLLGEYVRADGTVVRNPDGSPVMRGEPVLEEAEWLTLQETASLIKYTKGPSEVSPVRGFLYCDGSDYQHPLYWAKGGRRGNPRIRCQGHRASGRKPCPDHSWGAEALYEEIGRVLTGQIGHLPAMERRTVTDDSRAIQVAVLDGRLEQLTKELQAGKLSALEYGQHIANVAAEREALTSAPEAKPRAEWTETGQTYREWWDSAPRNERREKLISWGVKVYASAQGIRFEYGDGFPSAPLIVTRSVPGHGWEFTPNPLFSGDRVALAA